MLAVPKSSRVSWSYRNWGTDAANQPGTSVTPGTSNSEGSWTQVAASSDITHDVVAFSLWLHSLSGTGDRSMLLDIGIDPAGGTSYTSIIDNLVCGNLNLNLSSGANHGSKYYFPLYIPSGSSVAVRCQCSSATGQTVRAALEFWGVPSQPYSLPVATFSETIGTITNSQGVSFTPGNASDGSWTSLGTTSHDLWWFQLAYSIANATITAEYTYIDVAFGDGSNKHLMMRIMHAGTASETVSDASSGNFIWANCYHPIPSGTTIYVRGRCLNAPDSGYNAVVIGLGG